MARELVTVTVDDVAVQVPKTWPCRRCPESWTQDMAREETVP
jgi:hypothetical protein